MFRIYRVPSSMSIPMISSARMADHAALEDITNCPIHNIDEDNNVFSTTTTRPSRTEHRLRMLAKVSLVFQTSLNISSESLGYCSGSDSNYRKTFRLLCSMKNLQIPYFHSSPYFQEIISAAMRPFGTARLTPGRQTGRQQQTQPQQISTPEPMIGKLGEKNQSVNWFFSNCPIGYGVPDEIGQVEQEFWKIRTSTRMHMLLSYRRRGYCNSPCRSFLDRIAVKITCSDNNMYRVTPVYATVEPGQSLPLHIARITSDLIKRDRLCVNILEADGNKEAREIFKKNANTRAPASINMALEATNDV
ncbi:Protein CBG16675 [Caenorhabditis briggsae]|uniref:Protein CBG16675 n=1 Tax=Caenorhabditis briggsae TaxID=6238 RepID=A8XPA5_CAEBR|nr:Protein CBG16675 [Caenorhabditis briggsae]CAP34585.2 Protein CBG16675 [Caenorhabditis briggsae]